MSSICNALRSSLPVPETYAARSVPWSVLHAKAERTDLSFWCRNFTTCSNMSVQLAAGCSIFSRLYFTISRPVRSTSSSSRVQESNSFSAGLKSVCGQGQIWRARATISLLRSSSSGRPQASFWPIFWFIRKPLSLYPFFSSRFSWKLLLLRLGL